MSTWDMEKDDSFGDRDVWRLVDSDDAERWRRYETSARCPYVATVYSQKVATEMCEAHNNMSLPTGPNRTAILEVLDDWRLSEHNEGHIASTHEGYALLRQHLDWLWSDIKSDRPPGCLRARARELAAMSLKFIVDCTEAS